MVSIKLHLPISAAVMAHRPACGMRGGGGGGNFKRGIQAARGLRVAPSSLGKLVAPKRRENDIANGNA